MINYLLLVSRQGKVRLSKWYVPLTPKEKVKIVRDAAAVAIGRPAKLCNVLDFKGGKLICKRYASLTFIAGVDQDENELLCLEIIQHFVEVLDKYFGNVCELDLIFNFHKASYLLDEVLLDGQLQESSKKVILKFVHMQECLLDEQAGGAGLAE